MSRAPHLEQRDPVTIRRGALWILGDPSADVSDQSEGDIAPMFVEWEAPALHTARRPVVFVHGGGGQSLDWRFTVDGRSGWVDRFVGYGYPVYLVDRPGHGRSRGVGIPGPVGASPSPEQLSFVFGGVIGGAHTQWPWPLEPRSTEIRSLAAASAPLAADLAAAEMREADRLVGLLERIGPATIITHSLGACGIWRASALRPDLIAAVIAIEPPGPPYATLPGVGELAGGLTAAPLPVSAGQQPLRGIPVRIVAGEVSPFRGAIPAIVSHLGELGAQVRVDRLEDHGLTGNGHGVMLEANSDEVADFVRRLIERVEDIDGVASAV